MITVEGILREFLPHRDEEYIPDLAKALESHISLKDYTAFATMLASDWESAVARWNRPIEEMKFSDFMKYLSDKYLG